MKKLEIEWRHLDKEAITCDRCKLTGDALKGIVDEVAMEARTGGWEVIFKETLLSEDEISESNLILINGIPMEDLLPNAKKSENCCASCGEILGESVMCRTIESKGLVYEAIPAAMIQTAIRAYIRRQNSQ